MYKFVKRLFDFVISLIGLILLSPVFLIIAIAIKCDSKGPVIFKQKRVGKNKKHFMILKFRTMYVESPSNVATHELTDATKWITKVGGFLRRTSLDELPQIINILVGQMSIIGPRPALWNQFDLIEERDKYGANDIRPGLTGWAQINGRDELENTVKAKLDGEYVEKLKTGKGFSMDWKCFWGTVASVLKHEGVVEGGTGALANKPKEKIMVVSAHTPSLFWFRMDMMQKFIALGYDVVAVANEEESLWKDKFSEYGIKYMQVYVKRNGANPFSDLKTLKHLKKIFKAEKPSKAFLYNAKAVIYGGIAAKKYKIESYPLIAGVGSIFMANNLKGKILQAIMCNGYKKGLKNSKVVFFQNKDDSALFLKKKLVKESQIVYIAGSGVNTEKFKQEPLPNETSFLFIGRLLRDKGIQEYLNACEIVKSQYPNVKFSLVGPFDTNPSSLKENDLNKYVESGVIEYFGEQTDVRPYLKQCTVFVLPSYREGTPKTVLEAMATGRAVITTNAPGCKETVVDGVNGFLVPVKNANAIAEKMIELINDRQLVATFAENGAKIAREKFSVEIVNDAICKAMNI